MASTPSQTALIEALERELHGYVRRGLSDRAGQVRQELLRLGSSVATIAETVPAEPESTHAPDPASDAEKPATASKKATATKTPAKPRKARK